VSARLSQLESGALLSYQEAKRLLRATASSRESYALAVERLYLKTGGNRWTSRADVLDLNDHFEDALEKAATCE
jgi:hypothetical protein